MTTLQEFIENKFVEKYKSKERVKLIDIDEHFNRVFKEIANKEIEGGKLDLSDYPNLERLRVNSDCLKNSLTELLLNNNPNLKTLVITNSPNLTSINISGCSNLNIMNVNGMELIETCRSLEVKGWKQTKLLNEEYHEILERELTAEAKQVVDTFPKIKCNIS